MQDTQTGLSIGQFGLNPNGTPSAGPFGFLPSVGVGSSQGSTGSYIGTGTMPYTGQMPGNTYTGAGGTQYSSGGGIATPAGAAVNPSASSGSASNSQAQNFESGTLNGTNLPFSPAAIANLQSQASDSASASEAANNQSAVNSAIAGGSSGSDPSLKGIEANNEARRQTQVADSNQQIQTQANEANYAAQQSAAQAQQQAYMQQQQLNLQQQQLQEQLLMKLYGQGNGNAGQMANGQTVGQEVGAMPGFYGSGGYDDGDYFYGD